MVEAGRVTAIIDGDIGPLKGALAQAKSQATSAASGIENDFKKGFGSGLQSSVTGLTASMGPLGSAISGVSGGLGLAATGGLAAVAAFGALGAAAVSTAADWQSLMAGVSKTTGVEGAGLDQLSADLQRIRTETGATAADIANATITAGSVGIPKEELAGFTEVALQMGSAFSMSSEAAVSGISAIGNSAKESGTSWTEFATRAGSSVNVLADSMRTSEEQILTGMTHLGATMGLLKPPQDTIPEWMALG
ncbi:MAG: phage tail tape measure protein, partial [Syntrophomonas sp.]|nr:phage tail tape measure protein [Syntrophomonas sp.]